MAARDLALPDEIKQVRFFRYQYDSAIPYLWSGDMGSCRVPWAGGRVPMSVPKQMDRNLRFLRQVRRDGQIPSAEYRARGLPIAPARCA